ncbi:glycosyl hydrolase 53 family protein [Streptomyces scabiei]|uniref:glycosyl hydrolase 53 family protein n=1 Tax=Streptomyces scabiei TaxID=1930 RepID=UPI00298F57E2|nr:glycosyl hydrolase 53 family protein [Streptomyces scabiei]MDW8803593.1 glycosyl hydrolase 53 family protein [Streptomyces scabiei]
MHLKRLIRQGTTPEKAAVGNEIINGFVYGSEAAHIGTTNPPYFVDQANVHQSKPGGGLLWKYWRSTAPAERQLYDQSWDRFTTLAAAGMKAVRDASPTSKVEIHVIVDKDKLAETAYPASGGEGSPVPNSPCPRTVQGQADAVRRVFQAANDVVDNRGSGVLVWEPPRSCPPPSTCSPPPTTRSPVSPSAGSRCHLARPTGRVR